MKEKDILALHDDLIVLLEEGNTPLDLRRAVGLKLSKMRLEAGMTCEQVAESIGVAHGTIYNYENGDTKITLENAVNLLRLYNSKTGKRYSLDKLTNL